MWKNGESLTGSIPLAHRNKQIINVFIMRSTAEAFCWIVHILRIYKIKFQITGGLAAKTYGAKRKLADIDIDIPEKAFKKIIPAVQDYIIWGPARLKDANWHIQLMTLEYKGQKIDLCSDKCMLRGSVNSKWLRDRVNFTNTKNKKLFGLIVPVINLQNLINYKTILGRPVDISDIKAIKK